MRTGPPGVVRCSGHDLAGIAEVVGIEQPLELSHQRQLHRVGMSLQGRDPLAADAMFGGERAAEPAQLAIDRGFHGRLDIRLERAGPVQDDMEVAVGEMAVGELEMVTGVGQPGLSQQLAILRKAEMVNTRRAAKQVYYSLTADALKAAAQLVGRLAGLSAQAVAPRAARSAKRGSAVVFPKIL